MDRVLEQHAKLDGDWAPDSVHDLRVALRRCILIAEVMRNLDPGVSWKPMRKSGRRLFRQLGTLRDTQVLTEWVQKLGSPDDASTAALLEELNAHHEQNRVAAQKSAKEFDRKQWRSWARELAGRYRHMASDKAACESVLLEHWEGVRDSYRRAQKSRSSVCLSPDASGTQEISVRHTEFSSFNVSGMGARSKIFAGFAGRNTRSRRPFAMIKKNSGLFDETARAVWAKKLQDERASRLQQYRAKMAGKASLIWIWRAGLPGDRELRSTGWRDSLNGRISLRRIFPACAESRNLRCNSTMDSRISGLIGRDSSIEERFILQAAALLHEVGRSRKNKAHHKESYRMIRRMKPPVGWTKKRS